ncbi:DUF1289 domain-containing protein [Afifella marina]|uniref:Predicted Fe-S protein YdhL, DUF1289 family n=1 Tax=Afifella marina DSM 2698 TaxID=1120955 RepID=A0A1G5M8W0_AFIMA|nr:DUF1289 domain-containing protein [Afifella marina]MBK1622851.1 DUF1289 domain-containing protein [Afifella marina DSM 2698]MBK1625846.1 DUF1289 domain-containing protein [Afifella marina]MBK5917668.1 hypothetical protein [Afifella marina]RAI23591.1 hypothetical protein CH311_01560 [Afifella marina DSM 2698]SCZ21244.1 Predicted Fe-S protein YdhL, DUF1289 family [Afifella marina DSM 2698]
MTNPQGISEISASPSSRRPVSPCTGVCEIDAGSGFCRGCARTSDEIAIWSRAPDDLLRKITAVLPGRRVQLGIKIARLDWDDEEIARFMRDTLRPGKGSWVFGIDGASGEFAVGAGEQPEVKNALTVATHSGAMRLRLPEKLRAFAFEEGKAIVLALPRGRLQPPADVTLKAAGPDQGAIREGDRDALAFELGLGSPIARIFLRTKDQALQNRLQELEGRPWQQVLAEAGHEIREGSADRVILTSVGRMEVYSRSATPGAGGPESALPELQAEAIAGGREMPGEIELPKAYAPCAIFYPAR